jgi:hypothetical protein
MDTDVDMFLCRSTTQLVQTVANIGTDGLLLYVAESSYEPGTSPLSSWIPIESQEPHAMYSLDLFERCVFEREINKPNNAGLMLKQTRLSTDCTNATWRAQLDPYGHRRKRVPLRIAGARAQLQAFRNNRSVTLI